MSHIQPDTTLPKTKQVGRYVAVLTQTGTADPTHNVLENTWQPNMVMPFTRVEAGAYIGDMGVPISNVNAGVTIGQKNAWTAAWIEDNKIKIDTGVDSVLDHAQLTIEVYDDTNPN